MFALAIKDLRCSPELSKQGANGEDGLEKHSQAKAHKLILAGKQFKVFQLND